MGWITALSLLALAGILFCAIVVGYACWWDRQLRGARRVSNTRVTRERVTVSLPSNWLRDFHEREYHDAD